MKTDTVTKLKRPASAVQLPPDDPLTTLLREGAQKLIAQAVEAELQTLLERHADKRTEDGRLAVVRNGYLPERDFQTGIGSMPVRNPEGPRPQRVGSQVQFRTCPALPAANQERRDVAALAILEGDLDRGLPGGSYGDPRSRSKGPVPPPPLRASNRPGRKSIRIGRSPAWPKSVTCTGGLTGSISISAVKTPEAASSS